MFSSVFSLSRRASVLFQWWNMVCLLNKRHLSSIVNCTAFFPDSFVSSNYFFDIFKASCLGTTDQDEPRRAIIGKIWRKKNPPKLIKRCYSRLTLLLVGCSAKLWIFEACEPCQLFTQTTVQKHLDEMALSLLTTRTHSWTLTYLPNLSGKLFSPPYWLMVCFSIHIKHVHECFDTLFPKILIKRVHREPMRWASPPSLIINHNWNVPGKSLYQRSTELSVLLSLCTQLCQLPPLIPVLPLLVTPFMGTVAVISDGEPWMMHQRFFYFIK